ncbi:MAG: hypothetical protein HUJ68_14215, partial [Clostridia bacterium]|nr:hypothetical protein [Clostridia bacterium]
MKRIVLTLAQKQSIGKILGKYIKSKKNRRRINKIHNRKQRLQEQKKIYIKNGYSKFTRCQKDAFEVADMYGITICPYCNMNCTHTTFEKNGKTVCRPDFEHFEPKSQVPWKAMNVMNIIPSCIECNERIKKEKPFRIRTHIHPFFDDFD